MGRPFICQGCGERAVSDTDRGRLPSRCDGCSSSIAKKSRQYRRRARIELAQARRQVVVRNPNRTELAAAVRAVGHAEGKAATVEALRRLADVALAWADRLEHGGQGEWT